MAGEGKGLKKRLLVNLDGTGQAEYTAKPVEVDGKKTSPAVSNVARIGRATLLEDEVNGFEQVVYYQTGLFGDQEKGRDLRQGTSGLGLTSNVREAYGFICNNYDYGDEIYITGFSRGAFTARSVAGVIGRCGILTKYGMSFFYEALQYYKEYNNLSPEQKAKCPVTPEAGTTRRVDPDTGEKIKIKAVGVWDTVGALSADEYKFHDLSLGDHIENAYHIMSLDEHRFYYDVTLWESPELKRSPQNFEQCWMAGDHSNIGGSWPDQQLSDITLAWMMSRFEGLGVKFDQTYLYREFLKFKDYARYIGPKVDGYKEKLNPRQWGEGRSRNCYYDGWGYVAHQFKHGGWIDRKAGSYKAPEEKPERYLQNTNETFHPAVRYRLFCSKAASLGYDDREPYDPGLLKEWTKPRAQPDGRIGQQPAARTPGPSTYEFLRDSISKSPAQKVPFTESKMGNLELVYLAFYDQDKYMQNGDGSIWKRVIGGDSPPSDIKHQVTKIIDKVKEGASPQTYPRPGAAPPQQPQQPIAGKPANEIYIGTEPAIADDTKLTDLYANESLAIKLGTWNGESASLTDGSQKDFTYAAFTALDRIKTSNKITLIDVTVNSQAAAIGPLEVHYTDGAKQQTCAAARYAGGGSRSSITLSGEEKIVRMETKAAAAAPKGGSGLAKIVGLKLETDGGRVYEWADGKYDKLADVKTVGEAAPASGWELRGFYGAETQEYTARLGPIWGITAS